jgi:Phage integrase, N-terminal SAM-like domain
VRIAERGPGRDKPHRHTGQREHARDHLKTTITMSREMGKGYWVEMANRVHGEAGWCPRAERQQSRERAEVEQAKAKRRVLFRDYAADYLAWAEKRHRSWTTTRSQVRHLLPVFGPKVLDEISTDDVERFLTSLLGRV